MIYTSIDIETTGIDPYLHQVIEFAAIVEDTSKQLPFEKIPKFHFVVRPYGDIIGQPIALSMNKRIFDILGNPKSSSIDIITPDELSRTFGQWIKTNVISKTVDNRLTVAGKNFGTFDKLFLEKLPDWKESVPSFHQRIIDPGTLYCDFTKDEVIPNTEECMKRAGLIQENAHNALYDAWNVIQLLRKKY